MSTVRTIEDKLRVAVMAYTGLKSKAGLKIKVYPDPKVPGTYAIRATLKEGTVMDFLYSGLDEYRPEVDPEELEECEFETWPPKSGDKYDFFLTGNVQIG